ncbi:FHA domain-containing protein [Microbacterium sp. SS28]|uniref:FHA domain-containing protein n=1 Tax=Microbacterium sp. SS28 TaxID=2919948 RepID=UPI001FAAC6C4|nr:FHA domain-containing protein [Microbacterium sp. SS28]
MSIVQYSRGDRAVVATDRGIVVLASAVPDDLPLRVWDALSAGQGLPGIVGALTAHGASLADLPAFAAILREHDAVRLAVRGDLAVTIETPSGPEVVSGAGVTTWSERVFREARTVSLGDGRDAARFPLQHGVVFVSALSVVWDRAEGTDAAPAPVAAREAPASVVEVSPVAAPIPAIDVPAFEPVDVPADVPAFTPIDVPAFDPVDVPADVPAFDPVDVPAFTPVEVPALFEPSPVSPPPADAPLVGDGESVDEQLWAQTVVRPFQTGAPSEQTLDDAPEDAPGDHDGATISVAQLRALREGRDESAPAPLAPPRPRAPGRIRLSTGQVVVLDRTVVVGRRPRSTRVTGTDLPHLVAVDSPQQDISRSHLELRVEGDSIVATDLDTTNGTTLVRMGADPVRLHPGESTVVVPGDMLDLGDGITIDIEGAG